MSYWEVRESYTLSASLNKDIYIGLNHYSYYYSPSIFRRSQSSGAVGRMITRSSEWHTLVPITQFLPRALRPTNILHPDPALTPPRPLLVPKYTKTSGKLSKVHSPSLPYPASSTPVNSLGINGRATEEKKKKKMGLFRF